MYYSRIIYQHILPDMPIHTDIDKHLTQFIERERTKKTQIHPKLGQEENQ